MIHGHLKTIVSCSNCRKEHAGRWNLALSPSETKLSAITGFLHFSSLDLTSEVTGSPRTLSWYINLFVSRRTTRSFFPWSSSSIRGETARGSYKPPLRRGRMRNGLCRRGLIHAKIFLDDKCRRHTPFKSKHHVCRRYKTKLTNMTYIQTAGRIGTEESPFDASRSRKHVAGHCVIRATCRQVILTYVYSSVSSSGTPRLPK